MQYCSVWVFQIPTTVILVYYKAVFVVYIKLSMILLSCIILRSLFTINGYLLCVIFITFYHTVLQLMFFQQHFYNKRDDVESNSHLIVKMDLLSHSVLAKCIVCGFHVSSTSTLKPLIYLNTYWWITITIKAMKMAR